MHNNRTQRVALCYIGMAVIWSTNPVYQFLKSVEKNSWFFNHQTQNMVKLIFEWKNAPMYTKESIKF